MDGYNESLKKIGEFVQQFRNPGTGMFVESTTAIPSLTEIDWDQMKDVVPEFKVSRNATRDFIANELWDKYKQSVVNKKRVPIGKNLDSRKLIHRDKTREMLAGYLKTKPELITDSDVDKIIYQLMPSRDDFSEIMYPYCGVPEIEAQFEMELNKINAQIDQIEPTPQINEVAQAVVLIVNSYQKYASRFVKKISKKLNKRILTVTQRIVAKLDKTHLSDEEQSQISNYLKDL